MFAGDASDWSPADYPQAIAMSEAQRWQQAVRLSVLRLHSAVDQQVSGFTSLQIDARLLILTLRQILYAEELLAATMEVHGVETAARAALADARRAFEDALPGIRDMRDALVHFKDWSRGTGRGPQKDRRGAGDAKRDVARQYWTFGYDPAADVIALGPYSIRVSTADKAARDLISAIHQAVRAVNRAIATDVNSRAVGVLNAAGIPSGRTAGEEAIWVRVKDDQKAWLSLTAGHLNHPKRAALSERVVSVLTDSGLRLVSINQGENVEMAERLQRGEAVFLEPDACLLTQQRT